MFNLKIKLVKCRRLSTSFYLQNPSPPPPQSGLNVIRSDVVSLLHLVLNSVQAEPTVVLNFSTTPTVLESLASSSVLPNEPDVLLSKSEPTVLLEAMSRSEPTVLEAIMSLRLAHCAGEEIIWMRKRRS